MSEYLNPQTGECYPLDTPDGLAAAVLAEQAGTARLARTLTRRLEQLSADHQARAAEQDATLMDLRAQLADLRTAREATGVDPFRFDPGIDPGIGPARTDGLPSRGTAWCWRTLTGAAADELLTRLSDWVTWLRSRYPLARVIPACWARHPELVEELTALHLAWAAAYTDPTAAPTAPADWHTHYLPAALERIPGWGVHCTDTHRPRPPGVYADGPHTPGQHTAQQSVHDSIDNTSQGDLPGGPPARTAADTGVGPTSDSGTASGTDHRTDHGTDPRTQGRPGHGDVAAGQEAS